MLRGGWRRVDVSSGNYANPRRRRTLGRPMSSRGFWSIYLSAPPLVAVALLLGPYPRVDSRLYAGRSLRLLVSESVCLYGPRQIAVALWKALPNIDVFIKMSTPPPLHLHPACLASVNDFLEILHTFLYVFPNRITPCAVAFSTTHRFWASVIADRVAVAQGVTTVMPTPS